MKNRCLYMKGKRDMEIRINDIPIPKKDEVVVNVKANGLCGSDIHFFSDGHVGDYYITRPYITGHEACGVVYSLGENVRDFNIGDNVVIECGIPCRMCDRCKKGFPNQCRNMFFLSTPPNDGTLCDYISIRSDMLHPMPDGMSFELGALVEPTAVAVHANLRAGKIQGESMAIIGAGTIGLLTLMAFKAMGGGKAIVVDINSDRLNTAKQLGADEVINPLSDEIPENYVGFVIDTAAAADTSDQVFRLIDKGGRIVQVGFPKNRVAVDGFQLITNEIDYVGSYIYANNYPMAIHYLATGEINGKALITHTYNFDNVVEAFSYAADNPNEVIKVMVIH